MKPKKITEVCYSNSMKINRGQYEQEAPFYSAKTIIEGNGTPVDEPAEYARLRGIIDPLLIKQYQEAKQDMANLRIRIKDGKKYPSVNTVLRPDPIPNIDPEYGIRGTEIHKLCNHFITTKIWLEPAAPLKTLKYEDIPYQKFFEKFKHRLDFTNSKLNIELFNDKRLYSGEADLDCLLDGIETLPDFKTGGWDWTALVAYWKCNPIYKQLAIFDLKNCEIEILKLTDKKALDAWEVFLIKRGELKARFGL